MQRLPGTDPSRRRGTDSNEHHARDPANISEQHDRGSEDGHTDRKPFDRGVTKQSPRRAPLPLSRDETHKSRSTVTGALCARRMVIIPATKTAPIATPDTTAR